MKTTQPTRWLWRTLASGLLLTCTACAPPHTSAPFWDKPGASDTEWAQVNYECERDTRQAARSFGVGYVAEIRANQFMDRCLLAHGWSPVR